MGEELKEEQQKLLLRRKQQQKLDKAEECKAEAVKASGALTKQEQALQQASSAKPPTFADAVVPSSQNTSPGAQSYTSVPDSERQAFRRALETSVSSEAEQRRPSVQRERDKIEKQLAGLERITKALDLARGA